MEFEITEIDVIDYRNNEFEATITVNDKFVVQLGTDGNFSIPKSNNGSCNIDREQEIAFETVDVDWLVKELSIPRSRDKLLKLANADSTFELMKRIKLLANENGKKGVYEYIQNALDEGFGK